MTSKKNYKIASHVALGRLASELKGKNKNVASYGLVKVVEIITTDSSPYSQVEIPQTTTENCQQVFKVLNSSFPPSGS